MELVCLADADASPQHHFLERASRHLRVLGSGGQAGSCFSPDTLPLMKFIRRGRYGVAEEVDADRNVVSRPPPGGSSRSPAARFGRLGSRLSAVCHTASGRTESWEESWGKRTQFRPLSECMECITCRLDLFLYFVICLDLFLCNQSIFYTPHWFLLGGCKFADQFAPDMSALDTIVARESPLGRLVKRVARRV